MAGDKRGTLGTSARHAAGFALALVTFVSVYRPKRGCEDGAAGIRANAGDRFWRELAVQDWIALFYLLALLACTIAGEGPRRPSALAYLTGDLAVFFGSLVLARGGVLQGIARALVYRLGLFVAVLGSFSHLQYVLPTARASVVDAELYALDLRLFHMEPAVELDRFVTTATTEWFSFFYFSYFFILAIHIFPFLFAVRRMRVLEEFSLGIVTIFCVAHLLYIVVPGHGPYHHLAGHFTHELDGPIWWRLVKASVDSVEVSARTDIFPSLHTAVPTYIALFSVRHRQLRPFRFTWIPMCLFASQIVLSTMFLRWHYLIDVIAGLFLAFEVSILGKRVAAWERERRVALGRTPVWTVPWDTTRVPVSLGLAKNGLRDV